MVSSGRSLLENLSQLPTRFAESKDVLSTFKIQLKFVPGLSTHIYRSSRRLEFCPEVHV